MLGACESTCRKPDVPTARTGCSGDVHEDGLNDPARLHDLPDVRGSNSASP